MLKKYLFLILLYFCTASGMANNPSALQGDPIDFILMYFENGGGVLNPIGGTGGFPRTPTGVPNVSQDGHILYFSNVGFNYTLFLLNDDDEIVYFTTVSTSTTSLVLPSYLSGNYTIGLYPGGNYYYEGVIEL